MTVSTGTNFKSYAGNGSTTTFAYTFKIFQDTNLVVTLVNDTTGVETTQTLTTDYTVTGVGSDSGGNVVFVTAPPSGNTAVIRRVLPITQETNYVPNDPFPAEAHEDALDKLTMLVQQEATSNDLAISFPEGDVGSGLENTLPSAADRAGQIISFDTSGNVSTTNIANVPSIGTVNLSVSGLASFADGSLGAPSITNIGDTNTGIYFPAVDQLAFTAGGNDILSLTSTFALFSKPLYLNSGIQIVDNSATALTIKEGSNNYLTIDTTNGSEKISFGSTANPTFEINGSFRQPLIAATTSFFSQTYSGASLLATNGSVNIESYSASKAGIVLNGSGDQITFTSPTLGFVGLVQVVGAITTDTSLNIASSTTVDGILDEDDMASNSATKLATQQSIKAYVDAQVGTVDTLAEVLGNGNTTGGTAIQMTTTDELQFRDTALKISSSADGQLDIDADTTIQIVAPTVDIDASTEVNISGTLTVGALIDTPDIETSTVSARDGTTSFSIANSTGTASFDNSLTISRNSGTGILPTLDIICTDTTAIQNQTLGALDFQTSDTNEAGTLASIRARKTNSTSASTNLAALELYTGRPGDLIKAITINADQTTSFAAAIDVTGAITVSGTVDGRDVSADGTKLDGIEASADVTDTANVTAAGALMDSELTNIAAVKALNQGLATTDEPSFDNTTLNAIAATISDTAVDIFVYDTRKDSDGGAWRKRTQHTSWYNEAASATRGSRKEFPAVAVIVAETNQVTIYDGDDPDMPMWMVFNYNSGVIYYTHAVSCVSMLNGILTIGISSTYGVSISNFVTEEIQNIRNTFGVYTYNGSIVDRNSSSGQTLNSANPLVNGSTNDVAMTVLPNAPIDAATGLPVPTIAVATDGGVSVIKDDGTVVDITTTYNTNNTSDYIDFTSDSRLYFCSRGKNYPIVADIPSSDISSVQSSDVIFWPSAAGTTSGLDQVTVNNTNVTDIAATTDNSISFGGPKGIIYAQDVENISADKTAVFAQITSDFNTGYQNGDIKLATLSDTDATNVTGAELVTNGTFDSDVSGWTASTGATVTYDSGRMKVAQGTSDDYVVAYQAITTVVGKTYTVSFDTIDDGSSSTGSTLYVRTTPTSGNIVTGGSGFGSHALTFTATATTTYISAGLGTSANNVYVLYDNVSVRLAEEDRSVNGNGLQVFGTVTKSAVATGADLVAYSGFSTSNYLLQPVNTDLPSSSTDTFSMMAWAKTTTDSAYQYIISFGENATGKARQLSISPTNGYATFDNVGASVTGTVNYGDNTWHHFCVVYTGSSDISIYVDGILHKTGTTTLVTSSSPDVKIGINQSLGSYSFDGSIALSRISATAPSPEQIKKIYEDEKFLFQENAQATLYGSSDAVTALAYDDTTDLLHVGTSAGRSAFQGLRRVDNTTTAVGAAISASNGLVADE